MTSATMGKPAEEAAPALKNMDGSALVCAIGPDGGIKVTGDGMEMGIRLPPMAPAILRHVDGKRTIGEIRAVIGADEKKFHRHFAPLYNALNGMNLMLLRY